ncbi:hypothetical protein DL93DRAFT_1332982 [Clavulina sp. PMI_390]|nr:hypothetical protein DL93DRAFT_1332982 [Clavulina sp. PMI_390]
MEDRGNFTHLILTNLLEDLPEETGQFCLQGTALINISMEFARFKSALAEIASRASSLPQAAKELPHIVDTLPHVSQEPIAGRRSELRKRFADAEIEADECLSNISIVQAQLFILQRALELRKAEFRAQGEMIHALPFEILSRIFSFAMEFVTKEPKLSRRAIIMLVCHRWHKILLQNPAFWTYQRVVLRKRDDLSAIEPRFQRAGPLPLQLSLCVESDHASLGYCSDSLISTFRKFLGVTKLDLRDRPKWLSQLQLLEVRGHERICCMLTAGLLEALDFSHIQELNHPSLLSQIAVRGEEDRSCSDCGDIDPWKARSAVADRLDPLSFTSLSMNRRLFFVDIIGLHQLKDLALANPQNVAWGAFKAMLTSMTRLESLTLERIMPKLRPSKRSDDLVRLPCLSSLVLEACDCPLLVSILRELEAPGLNYIRVGFAELSDLMDSILPSEIKNAMTSLRRRVSGFSFLPSLITC